MNKTNFQENADKLYSTMELTWWDAFETCFTYDPPGPTKIGQTDSVRGYNSQEYSSSGCIR